MAGALGERDNPMGQGRPGKLPSPGMGLLLGAALHPSVPGGRLEAPLPRPTPPLSDSEAPGTGPQGRLAITVSDALEVRDSPEPNGLLHGFSCPATSQCLPPPLSVSPLPRLRAPPVSPACLGNPCLPVARETTSLATSWHPYDMYMWEGKVPASRLGCLLVALL